MMAYICNECGCEWTDPILGPMCEECGSGDVQSVEVPDDAEDEET